MPGGVLDGNRAALGHRQQGEPLEPGWITTDGSADPIEAAETAKELGIPIFTIALGTEGGMAEVTDQQGNVRRVHSDGTNHVVATLPTGGGFGPLGLTADAPGNLYVAVTTSDPATQGVYRVARNGATARLAALIAMRRLVGTRPAAGGGP